MRVLAYDARMPFAIARDGTRIAYVDVGSGPPLLLIPGQASERSVWNGARDDFAARHRVLVMDHRGTGESDCPRDGYSTREMARDAIAVLDAAGVARAHAYGISMGGRIAQWLGIEHASRLGGLVLGCTTPGNAHGVARSAQANLDLASGDPARMLEYNVSPGWAEAHPELLATQREVLRTRPVPPHARRMHYVASEEHDAWARLPEIAVPTLIVHGSEDRVNVPENARLLASRIPGAVLRLMEGGRHAYYLEFRPGVSELVMEFLRACEM